MKLIEISKKLEEVIEKSDLYDSIKIFKNELTLLYLSIHGTKHNWERVEWLVDIVKLVENTQLNWNEVFWLLGNIWEKCDKEF